MEDVLDVAFLLGSLAAACCVHLLVAVVRLRSEVDQLQRESESHRHWLAWISQRIEGPQSPAEAKQAPVSEPAKPVAAEPARQVQEQKPVAPPLPIAEIRLPPPLPQPVASERKLDLESLIGANWLARIGVAALALAAAFFLQHAFRSGWIGPFEQVLVGFGGAAALYVSGQALLRRERYRTYGQILASGGLAVYFLTVYAAYNRFHLLGFGPAFGAMAVGAMAASLLAVKNETEAVAVICMLGAFAAPALIREEGGPGPGGLTKLYLYLALLDLWTLGLMRARPWKSLGAIAVGGTWIVFLGAGGLGGGGWAAVGFAFAFLLGTLAAGVALASSPKDERLDFDPGVLVAALGVCAFLFASYEAIGNLSFWTLPSLTLPAAAATMAVGVAATFAPATDPKDATFRRSLCYLASAPMLVSLIALSPTVRAVRPVPPPLPEEAPWAFGFSVLALIVFLAMAHHGRRREEGTGPACVMALSAGIVHFALASQALKSTTIWETPAIAAWALASGLILIGFAWLAARKQPDEPALPSTLVGLAPALAFFGLVASLGDSWRPWPWWSAAILCAAYAVVALAVRSLSALACWKPVRFDLAASGALALAGLLLVLRAVQETRRGEVVVAAAGCLAMATVHGVAAAPLWRSSTGEAKTRWFHAALAALFVALFAPLQWDGSWITLFWAAQALAILALGLELRDGACRRFALGLLCIASLKALLVDSTVTPEPFAFLWNMRILSGSAIIGGAIGCAALLQSRRERLEEWERTVPLALAAGANVFAIYFLSADLYQHVESLAGAQGRISAPQLALSLFWTAYALAAILGGIWRRNKTARLFGMGLLYLSVLKTFVFDLAGLEQPYKIVSFLALGLILLSISFAYTRFEERIRGAPEAATGSDAGPSPDVG